MALPGSRLLPVFLPPAYPVMQPSYIVRVNRRPICIRFLCTFAIAAVIWVLLVGFFSRLHRYHPWPGRLGIYPVPPHVTLEHCVSYADWSSPPSHQPSYGFPLTAVTTFDLPLSGDALLLLSRGPNSAGSVDIVTSSKQDQDVVTVEVVVSYFREDIRDDAKVCRVGRREGEIGVGIFTREWALVSNRLHFTTKIILPESSTPHSPLLINKFETDVVNTAHRVGDLNEKVRFQSLVLKGSNGHIDVESVKADQGIITTSNGGIQGIFNTSTSLALYTSNGRINVDVGLSSVHESEPMLNLATSNAAITSKISLISDEGLGGLFHTTATTSNGRLEVDFPASPPYSRLNFMGKTSNAQAAVSLNPAYEGLFYLQTSISDIRVNQDKSVIDPSGRDRKRSLNIKQAGKRLVSGDVYWGYAGSKVPGSVSVRTSNAHVDLNL